VDIWEEHRVQGDNLC